MSDETEELPPIDYATYVARPVDDVWEAVSTGAGWSSWFTTAAEIEPRAGGRYRFRWDAFGADRVSIGLEGPVVEWTPGERFAFEWATDGDDARWTLVTFRLEPRPPGTIVRVTEHGYRATPGDVVGCLHCAAGWGEALTLLKVHLEHGVTYGPVPAPDR